MPASPSSPVLILGGGLAGASAATALARAGITVTLVERERGPRHKVCGEFLSGEALEILASLDVHPPALGAKPVSTVRLCSGQQVTEAPLPFIARSLTRHCLDAALLACAESAGATVLRGEAVEALTQSDGLWQATLHDGTSLRAPVVLLATGKHDLRGLPRPPGRQNDLVALKMYWQLAPAQAAALSGAVELLLHPHGYTGLEAVEADRANLCALVRRTHLAKLGSGFASQGGSWPSLLAELLATNPHARTRLAGAEPLLAKPLAIASIPYGFVRREAIAANLYAVGDQAAVIPSFTGDGMSIALFSGLRAAQALLAGEPAQSFQRQLHRDLHRQVARAAALSRALIHPWLRPVVTTAAHLWPHSMRLAAHGTRIQPNALAQIR